MNCGSPVHLPYSFGGSRRPWAIAVGAEQKTRAFVLGAGFFKLIDRLTELIRLTNAKRALSATQKGIIIDTVTMPLFLQDPFNFNV
ncbi:hypothetical protein [Pseudomonas sp. NFACC05-1]|uniref:hypothetical protein n=1 Tax=Pseudomonas sp. NFACC05-1 TaxID=1566241 RepID=UPI001113D416|nr:hypothetical protein [Pseudomonas sp. NFACC05-1]